MSMSIAKKSANIIKSSKSVLTKAKEQKLEKEMETMKKVSQFNIDLRYESNYRSNLQYEEKELCIFNHKGWISGYFDNDTTSSDLVLMRCGQKQPKGILLGDCNINDFAYFDKGVEKYRQPAQIEQITGENLIGRQHFINFFRGNFPRNMRYYKNTGDYAINEIDQQYKRKIFNGNLTLSYYGCFYEGIKIIFSSPNKLLHFEDLIVNYSLEQLQLMFIQTLQEYKKRAKTDEFNPPLIPPELYEKINEITQEIHGEKLFEKKCLYSAAVFRKIHKLYPDNILFMPNNLVQRTYEHIVDSFCPDFDEIYRNKEFKQKLRDAKTDLETLEEYLEKICIVSHLINKEFIFYLLNDNNPLKIMFGGKFANYPDKLVTEIFNKINTVYQKELEKLFFDDMKRIETTVSLGRVNLRDYTEEIQKWEKYSPTYKDKKFPKNKFVVDKHSKTEEINFINQLLLAQIGINIRNKELEGKNMNIKRLHLRNYLSSYKTKQNIDIFNELIVEANAYLGLLKLPQSFKKYSKIINEILYKQLEEILGEDPYENYKSSIIKIYNQLKGIDPFIVKDGSEPEMKDNMLKKNQMNLIEINESLIWDKKDIAGNSLDSEQNKKQDNILTYDISQETDEVVRNKLTTLKEIQIAFNMERKEAGSSEQDQGRLKDLMLSGKVVDMDILKDKSIDELKTLDLEEIGSYDIQFDEDGQVSHKTLYENHHEIVKLEKQLSLKQSMREDSFSKMSNVPEDKFHANFLKLSTSLKKNDTERSNRISRALETGAYIDDPIYIEILLEDDKFLKIREKFLNKYFSKNNQGSDVDNVKRPLLDKYATMPGDIVKNMMKDNVFYKSDSAEGKQTTQMFESFLEEIDEEEGTNKLEENYAAIGNSEALDNEVHEIMNIEEVIRDNLEELNKSSSKKIYYDPEARRDKVLAEKSEGMLDYEKGRRKGKKLGNEKLKLL